MSVVVFGSINMDLVVRTPRFPAPGETISGRTFYTAPGGKGANQAVACARLETPVRMVGRVGQDVFGQALLASLGGNGVDPSGVLADPANPTGTALIMVDDAAENTIVVVAGANGAQDESDLRRVEQALKGARLLLLQLEVPLALVVRAAGLGRAAGLTVVLDPAPAQLVPVELYPLVDIITPNEHEAALLVGHPVTDIETARLAAQTLLGRGARQAIIKLGGKGAFWTDGLRQEFIPPYPVKPVDTVAAGDAFNGALAAALGQGLSIAKALRWAAAAGALSTTRPGAQPSMPNRAELAAFV